MGFELLPDLFHPHSMRALQENRISGLQRFTQKLRHRTMLGKMMKPTREPSGSQLIFEPLHSRAVKIDVFDFLVHERGGKLAMKALFIASKLKHVSQARMPILRAISMSDLRKKAQACLGRRGVGVVIIANDFDAAESLE